MRGKEWKRTLSFVLAAAMMLTVAPQTAMPVVAAEEGVETYVGGGVNEDPQTPVTEGQTPEEGTGSEEPVDGIETPDREPVEDPEAESGEEPTGEPAEEPVEEPADPAAGTTVNASTDAAGDMTAATETAQYAVTAVVKIDGQEVTDLQNNEIVNLELPEGKISGGGSVTFKAVFKEGKAATYEFVKIAYTMGGREVDCTSTWESRGSQRTISNVTGDVTVIVEAAKRFQPKITFVNPENLAEITDIRINGETAETGKLPAAEDIWELEAVEGASVSFKITPRDFLKLDRVTYETEQSGRKGTLSADTSGVYTITNLTENTGITVEASLDPAKSYGFVFTTPDESRTAKMKVELPAAADGTPTADFDGITGEPHGDGETVYTRNDRIIVSFLTEEGYTLDNVKVDGEAASPLDADSGKYQIILTKGNVVKISAKTVADAHEEDLKIAFTVSGNSVLKLTSVRDEEGKIENENNIIYHTAREGYYTLKKGRQKLFFDIESIYPSWKPVVNYYKEVEDSWYMENLTLEPYASRVSDGKTIYSYRMTAKQLGEIREDEEWDDDERTKFWEVNFRVGYEVMDIKYSYSFTGADRDSLNNVNVSINGRTAEKVDQIRNEVTRNSQIPIRIWAKDGSSLNSVTYKVGNEEKTAKVAKNAAEFTVKVTDNTVITIDASGIPVAQPLKAVVTRDGVESEEEVASAKNVYNVSYDGKYVARIAKGQPETQVYAKVTAVALKKGNSEVKPQDDVVEVRDNGTKVVVDLSKATDAIDGQKLTLSLTAGGRSFSYPLQVSKKIAQVSDITAPASIKQPVGTTKYYKVTTKGEFDRLNVRLDKDENNKVISEVAFEKGQLKVTTAQTADTAAKADGVKIIVFSQEMPEVKKEIAVETTSLLPANKPSVSLKAATDIDLTLAVSAATDADVNGAVYYKVEAKQSPGQTNVPDTLKKEVTAYFLKDGKSQDITVNVGGTKTVEGEGGSTTEVPVEYGEGGACKYDVTVSLVHTNKAVTGQDGQVQEETSGIDSVTVVEAGTNEKQIFKSAKPFATQKASWETNLKLKKGTTTVYTGQGEVQIAEAQFGKSTTYKVFDPKDKNAVKDVTENLTDGEKLEVTVTQEGRIYATAKSETRLGKHTVRVNAPTLSGMAASSATVAVTVVRGIETIGVSVPAVSLYKGINKKTTLKAAVVYNGDMTGKVKEKQPKTKKVEWELVAVTKGENDTYTVRTVTNKDGEKEDVLFGNSKVNIKNGTVTVAKDFEIAADDEKNTFVIRAAIDRKGKTKIGDDTAVGYSEPVTITNEGIVLYKLQLMKGSSSRMTGYKNSRILEPEASQIDGTKLCVFDNRGEEVSWENLSVKSSRPKDVDIVAGEDGEPRLKVYKAKTSVVLTVTANDGSGQKLAVKIKPACENVMVWADSYWNEKKDLGLRFYTLLPDGENGEKSGGLIYSDEVNTVYDPNAKVQREASYKDTTRLRAKVVVIDTEETTEYDEDKGDWVRKSVTTVREGEFVDCTVKITGGVKSAETGRNIDFTASGKQVKVELSGKVTERKWDSKKRKNVDTVKNIKKVYTLDNLDVGTTTGVTAKALGSLHQTGTKAEQETGIELKIPNAVAENLKGTGKSAVAKVDLDWTKLNAKNSADLYQFMAHLSSDAKECAVELKPTADGKYQTAVIKLHFDQDMKLMQNSYALKVTAGTKATVDGKEEFTPAAAAAAVAVKVDKPKKFTFKPATSYTISSQESSALLTGNAKNILAQDLTTETYECLYNANIKGEVNRFTEYFEIIKKTDAGKTIYQIALKNNVKISDITDKNDLIGFLQYTADTDKTYYEKGSGTGTNIVKITVKLK